LGPISTTESLHGAAAPFLKTVNPRGKRHADGRRIPGEDRKA
jgi:hypothetical protein